MAEGIGCTPPDAATATAEGYNRIWSCNDQILDENRTAGALDLEYNVSGYISTLCPTLCKSATVHEITIDINTEKPAAINVTTDMIAAYSVDKFNMTLAEYVRRTLLVPHPLRVFVDARNTDGGTPTTLTKGCRKYPHQRSTRFGSVGYLICADVRTFR